MKGHTTTGVNVLIVEDEAIIALDIRRLLLSCGYQVSGIASTADEALQAIEKERPEIVLMDIHIKGKADGIETAHRIRRRFRLPVIFVTAHADEATLDRARLSEPFGYIVKPIPALSLTGTIEMALHKHKTEQRLEAHRAWLTTVLRSIPDAVVVTDLAGQVQFINGAAEELTGFQQEDASDRPIDEVLPLDSGKASHLASQLIDKAEWGNRTVLPRDTHLRRHAGSHRIPVEGEVVISYSDEDPAGAVITLRDISQREQEERILRQEERTMALGHLASGISRDFHDLNQLVMSTTNSLTSWGETLPEPTRNALLEKTDVLFRAAAMGSLMTSQLAMLNIPPAAGPAFVSASGMLASVEPLFQKLCGPKLTLELSTTETSTLILCHPDRLQMVLLNLFMTARDRLAGQGHIRVSTERFDELRVSIRLHMSHAGIAKPAPHPLGMENEFPLTISQAIIAAMEGSLSAVANESGGTFEVLLPLQAVSRDAAAAANRLGTVLLVGSDLQVLGDLESSLEGQQYAVLRCASAAEALLLGQFHDGKIDCVIADGESVSAANRRRLKDFFGRRNGLASFLLLQDRESDETGWVSAAKSRLAVDLGLLRRLMRGENMFSATI